MSVIVRRLSLPNNMEEKERVRWHYEGRVKRRAPVPFVAEEGERLHRRVTRAILLRG